MTRRFGATRKLQAESLESRQMLHGGAMASGETPTTEERVEGVFERLDANEDMELSEDEVSERLWDRISTADGDDENTTVSAAELTAHLEARAAERAESGEDRDRDDRQRNRGRYERLTAEERVDAFFAEHDTNEDGVITDADEVSEELFARIADADVDGDGVSPDDLLAHLETLQAERAQARFDAGFARLDDDGDGGITAEEAGERRWEHISVADTDEDGSVSSDELQTYLETQRAEREAERQADMLEDSSDDMNEDGTGEPVTVANAQEGGGRQGRGGNRGGRGRR